MRKSAMAKTPLFFLLLTMVFLHGFAAGRKLDSKWEISAVKINGFNDIWLEEALNFEKKVKVDYGFKNDADNLYVLFVFKDSKYISNIVDTGLTIWLNAEGKKKKNYGIRFREKQVTADDYISLIERQWGTLSEKEKGEIRSIPNYYIPVSEVLSKKESTEYLAFAAGKMKTPWFRAKKQKGTIVYELSIPLERNSKAIPGIGIEPGKNIKVEFEWGGLTKEMKLERGKLSAQTVLPATCSSAGCAPDHAGKKGSVEKSSFSNSRSSSNFRSFKQHSFWIDVQLADLH